MCLCMLVYTNDNNCAQINKSADGDFFVQKGFVSLTQNMHFYFRRK